MIETIASILKLKGREIWSVGPDATVTKPESSSSQRRLSAPPELAAGWSDISEYRRQYRGGFSEPKLRYF